MATGIPVIDISGTGTGRARIGQAIDTACRQTGFLTVTGHGIPNRIIDTLRDKAHDFFARPLTEKLRAEHPIPGTPRGYIAMGLEALSLGNARDTPPDLKEYYHFGRETWPQDSYYIGEQGQRYFQQNLWPEEPKGFAEAAADYYAAMEALTRNLMRLSALGLGIDEHFFDDKLDRHITAMRLNYYPAQHTPALPGQLRAGAHTDYGLLTILNGENTPGGLQVQIRDGSWIDVETEPGSFVINIGDLLMRWTNDRWVSNNHRVVNPPLDTTPTPRLSIAFFTHPNYDANIEAIAPPGQAKYPPVLSGEYRTLKYQQTRVAAE
jgi:isopenicillin N synthase-like dioxygenase